MQFFKRGEYFYNFIIRDLIKDGFERLVLEAGGLQGPASNLGPETYVSGKISLPESSFIGARAFLEGDISIGENCYISPACTITGDIKIGENSFVEAGAVLSKSVPPNSHVSGYNNISKLRKEFMARNPEFLHEMHKPKKQKIEDYFARMFEVGKNVSFGRQVYVEGGARIKIGGNSKIGARCIFASNFHPYNQHQEFLKSDLRWDDIHVGRNVTIGGNTIICGGVVIGKGAKIAPGSVVTRDIAAGTYASGAPAMPNMRRRSAPTLTMPKIANYYSAIGHMHAGAAYFNEFESVKIEYTALINRGMLVAGEQGLEIRKGAMVSPRVGFITESPLSKGKITVGEHAWICSGATILPAVEIEKGAVIGAGSVVSDNIPANEIWAGKPARKIGMRELK